MFTLEEEAASRPVGVPSGLAPARVGSTAEDACGCTGGPPAHCVVLRSCPAPLGLSFPTCKESVRTTHSSQGSELPELVNFAHHQFQLSVLIFLKLMFTWCSC